MTAPSLERRLAKLEAGRALKANDFSDAVMVGVFNHDHEDIVGAGICGSRVWRTPGETIAALTARASRELGMQVLFAVYKGGTEAD